MLPELALFHYKARAYDPALGRFLQTDPVGYSAGDLNLYAYVGNDPLNRTDPTGMTCTEENGQVQCKVDEVIPAERQEMPRGRGVEASREHRQTNAERRVAAAERQYTRAVRQLLRHPDRARTITVNGTRVRVTAGQVARGLMGAHVRLDANSRGFYAYTMGGGGSERTQNDQPIITLEPRAFNDTNRNIFQTFGHEGIHTVRSTSAFIGTPDWNNAHQEEFNATAEELLQ